MSDTHLLAAPRDAADENIVCPTCFHMVVVHPDGTVKERMHSTWCPKHVESECSTCQYLGETKAKA